MEEFKCKSCPRTYMCNPYKNENGQEHVYHCAAGCGPLRQTFRKLYNNKKKGKKNVRSTVERGKKVRGPNRKGVGGARPSNSTGNVSA